MAKSAVQEFTKGLWAEIPPFRLVLGLCPTLAVTKSVENGFGMGIATTFVLVCSNILISLLRKVGVGGPPRRWAAQSRGDHTRSPLSYITAVGHPRSGISKLSSQFL